MAIKERLQEAFKTAVANFNGGDTCDTAVIKAASAHGLNVHETSRVVEIFNTGKAISHFAKAGSDRTSEFSLADQSVVIPAIFGDDAVQAAATKVKDAAPAVLHDYGFYESAPPRQIAGESGYKLEFGPDRSYHSLDGLARDIQTKIATLRQAAEACGTAEDQAQYEYGRQLDKIAVAFSAAPDRFPEYEQLCWDTYGREACAEFLGRVAGQVSGVKRANAARPLLTDLDSSHPELLRATHDAFRFDLFVGDMRQKRAELATDVAAAELSFNMALSGHGIEDAGQLSQEVWVQQPPAMPKQAQESFTMTDLMFGKPNERSPSAVDGAYDTVAKGLSSGAVGLAGTTLADALKTSPAASDKITERMRNLTRASILETLLVEDPIIRQAPPEVAVAAYRTIIQMAPEVSLQREVVRSALRQAVQSQGVSPYDAKTLAELDNQLRMPRGQRPQSANNR